MIQPLDQLFQKIKELKVGVIGDVMLDTYWWGNVERISPEAPVPVVAVSRRETRIGGAANVALNAAALGSKCWILSIIGEDLEGEQLSSLMSEKDLGISYLLRSQQRPTTNKIRIISRNQQMMRLDAEVQEDISAEEEKAFLTSVQNFLTSEKPDVIILEDYNKGLLTENTIKEIIRLANENGVITTVDPKRKNFFSYRNATLFKPNLHEVFTSLNMLPETPTIDLMIGIHHKLSEKLAHNISLVTLSENGVFYQENDKHEIIPSHRRNIADVSGAGDTVIAVASLVYAVSKDIRLSAEVANIAGGIVCEEVGTVAINRERLLEESKLLISSER